MTSKPNTTQRGYGYHHQQQRKRWAPIVATGTVPCARECGRLIKPGEPWHLDHADDGRRRYLGPAHRSCNIAASNRRGDPPPRPTTRW